jgi:hypothetical protein
VDVGGENSNKRNSNCEKAELSAGIRTSWGKEAVQATLKRKVIVLKCSLSDTGRSYCVTFLNRCKGKSDSVL